MSFVTRSGSQLLLNGSNYKFAGGNIFGAGLMEQDDGLIRYPTSFELADAFQTAQEMGATVIRSHTLGISVGNPLSVEPSLGVFNETALVHIDQAIAMASLYHQRLIIPLTDNNQYYHGGKHTFTDWRSISDETLFYTNSVVIADFQQYVSKLLTRQNTITGLYYYNDPTILAWQLGNEMLNVPTSWLTTMSAYIKSLDPNHLIMDGTYGIVTANLAIANIDLYDDHFYAPDNVTPALSLIKLQNDITAVAAANKCYCITEFDWLYTAQTQTQTWLNTILASSGVSGDLFWSLLFHNDVSGFTTHNDGYSLYYPGQDAATQSRVTMLRIHAYAMRGITPAPSPLVPATPTIVFSKQTKGSVTQTIAMWQGTVGAAQYEVEQSLTGPAGPFSVIGYPLNGPLSFSTSQVYLRITAQNVTGVSGLVSPVVSPLPFLTPTHNVGQFGIGTYQSVTGGSSGGTGLLRPFFMSLGIPTSGISGGTFGFVLDTTIRAPQQAQPTPAQEIGLDTTGMSVVRGFPSLIWSYGRLRPDAWYQLKRLYAQAGNAPPGYEYLVLLQYPDPQQNGAITRVLARWQPLTHSDRDVAVFENVQLRFTHIGLAQLDPNVPIQVV